jgi:hypothetical protein
MSNVIQFLEAMGKDATLSNMSAEEYATAVKALNVDDQAQHALLNRDSTELNNTLGGRVKMMMVLVPAEDDDQGEGEGKGNDDDQKQEEEISIN